MGYKKEKRIPKREEPKYKEIEDFEDFELINNTLYEMGIRTKKFKELIKKYTYCHNLSTKINKLINWDNLQEKLESKQSVVNDKSITIIEQKTAKENFEEALEQLEANSLKVNDVKLNKLLELDYVSFEEEIQISSLKNQTNENLINLYNFLNEILLFIPETIKNDLYIDFYSYYFDEETNIQQEDEFEESLSTNIYTKREFKKNYFIETIIDMDNYKISRTLHPLSKRKLITDHTLKFLSNHLILHKQAVKFLEDFFKSTQVIKKNQLALADAFFCYDYYKSRLEKVEQENKKREQENLENFVLQEALKEIEKINNDTYLSIHQKAKQRIQYEEVIRHEESKSLNIPTINKTSKYYIFNETKFKKSGITPGTAYNNYNWIKSYIDDYEYISIINSKQLF